ncbi:ImmA/IrrE family metallo-endopeptidase, partial [Paenibacillus larvae]
RGSIKGLYCNNTVWINKCIVTTVEKKCILVEELGHHYTTAGNILKQSDITNRKQELQARTWGYKKVICLGSIIQAHKIGIQNRYELADYLGVTEEFLDAALKRYQEIYGLYVTIGDYTVCFEPLGVKELFE